MNYSEERKLADLLTPRHFIGSFGANNNSIYLGNQQAAGNFADHWNYRQAYYQNICQQLKDDNIVGIVCCSGDKEQFTGEFEYLQLPLKDSPTFNIEPYLDQAYEFIDGILERGSILIHCNAGVTRSATITIYYLMRKLEVSFEKAHEMVMSKRSCINVGNFVNTLKNKNFSIE